MVCCYLSVHYFSALLIVDPYNLMRQNHQQMCPIVINVFDVVLLRVSRLRFFLQAVKTFQAGTLPEIKPNYRINPLTAGAVHFRFLHFILPHYISAFRPVKD